MAAKSSNTGSKYWYKISVETVRIWTFLIVLLIFGVFGAAGFKTLRHHFVMKQVEAAMQESMTLMARLNAEEDLFKFQTEWTNARSNLEQARENVISGDTEEALRKAERSRGLLQSILDSLLKKTGGEATFIGVHGQVEYRRGERGDWLVARNRTSLFEGDYIKTSSTGSAEVMMAGGALFTVRPDTVILVSSSRSTGGAPREQTLALESGWVNLSTSQTASRIRTPDSEAQVSRRSSASVTYDADHRTSLISSFRGRVDVVAKDGAKVTVNELEQVAQRNGSLSQPSKLPEAPALLSPLDNDEITFGATPEVTLSWEPVPGAQRYALQVSTNKLFVGNVIDVQDRRAPRARVGIRGEGSFVWRVAAFDTSGAQGPWSFYNRFRVTSQPQPGTIGAR